MKNKGFTLIEAIMTLFILGLIATVFLPAAVGSYKNIKKAEDINNENLLAQKEIDILIKESKEKIYDYKNEKVITEPWNSTINIFGKEIDGIRTTEKGFAVFVGEEPGELDERENLPYLKEVRIEDTTGKELTGGNAAVYWKDMTIIGYSEVEEKNNHSMNLYNWFVSKDGYLGFVPDSYAGDPNADVKYPKWPIDYLSIKTDSDFDFERQRIDDLKPYINNHIVFSVIPVALSGKYGIEKQSKEIYVMGPPLLDDIRFHFDTYTLRNNADNFLNDSFQIANWKDYSGSKTGVTYTPVYTNTSKKMFLEYLSGDGRAVLLNGTEAKLNYNPTTKNTFTVFLVYRNNSSNSINQSIIRKSNSSNKGWEIRLNNNKFEFLIDNSSSNSISLDISSYSKEKYIVTAIMNKNKGTLLIDRENNSNKSNKNFSSYTSTNSNVSLYLGGTNSEANIYEIIIYDSALSDDNVNEVRGYLAKKHRIRINP